MRLLLILFGIVCFKTQAQSDPKDLSKHLEAITKSGEYRTYNNIGELNRVAEYIYEQFLPYADTTYFQVFEDEGRVYKNVVAEFNPSEVSTIVIGAHYDVCGKQEGADDNASGVVGVLELAKGLKGKTLHHNYQLVAYTLEEPPYFRSEKMGSYVHAKSLHDSDKEVYGMLSVEMIAYFSEEKNSQSYPVSILKWFYGNKGDYITLVNKVHKGKFARKFSREYKKGQYIKTKRFGGPPAIPGIDFSDHLNYWKFGYSALMITDTAFLRNFNYHEKSDQMETLNLNKMAEVIDGLIAVFSDFD